MKKKYENKSITIPILNDDYKVVVCWGDGAYIEKILQREGLNYPDIAKELQRANGLTFYAVGRHPVIALPRFPETPAEAGTLAHEACHAVEHIFNRIGQKLGDELLAHSVGAVVRITLETKNVQFVSNKNTNKGKRQAKGGTPKKGTAGSGASR